MSDKENDVEMSNGESNSQESNSQADLTLKTFREKNDALNEICESNRKLTQHEIANLLDNFNKYEEVQETACDGGTLGYIIDADDALKRLEIIQKTICQSEDEISFNLNDYCSQMLESLELSKYETPDIDGWQKIGSELGMFLLLGIVSPPRPLCLETHRPKNFWGCLILAKKVFFFIGATDFTFHHRRTV